MVAATLPVKAQAIDYEQKLLINTIEPAEVMLFDLA